MYLLVLLILPFILYTATRLARLIRTALVNPYLLAIPGPFLARFTRLWYFSHVRKGHFEWDNINLHARYGPVVRLAPNHYSISDRAAVKTIYGPGSQFAKSAWYDGWSHPDPNKTSLFADRNIKRHAEAKKRYSSLYSMTSLIHYEDFVDRCADIFTQRVAEFARQGESFNLGHWFQCYAFDVIGDITFGQRFGFLDQGQDMEGAINAVEKVMNFSTLVGIYPEWRSILYHTLGRFNLSGPSGRSLIIRYVEDKIQKFNSRVKSSPETGQGALQTQAFLEKMVLARDKDPNKVGDRHLLMMGVSNLTAGSDTTSVSLSSIMYELLRNPTVLRRLRQEISEFTEQGRCSTRVTFKESQEMPYLQAVMKEAIRMHSATGLPLWRVVPAGGAEISGHFFPEGTVLGINTWVAHYDERVFPDAKAFRPERWIEAESNPETLKVMNEMYMPFGLGSRTCIGKHISILEMSKLIPRIVRDFDFELENEAWTTRNTWFVKSTEFVVKAELRKSS
ncbi:cytochrome P450 [Aspergillus ibericus CBS 121593]|uniref:Cytochrome protein n=1 Tax=Aspergillus ibericus CBS 121593 TaxID=1448316 RepID=A0A395H7F4_9EURO|nr:cytochrome protein [Aspergillus ibericus CBS 121593]RAL02154.1 cytochrome protein [Aspergillus ibericus CBS 121593]